MLHFEVELEVAYELSSRLHYLITLHYIIYIRLPDFVFFSTWYVILSPQCLLFIKGTSKPKPIKNFFPLSSLLFSPISQTGSGGFEPSFFSTQFSTNQFLRFFSGPSKLLQIHFSLPCVKLRTFATERVI